MGLYKRENGIYYIAKTIKGKTYRLSLQTKDRLEAQDRYDLWLQDFHKRRLNGESIFEAPLRKKNAPNEQDIKLDAHRPTLIQAFNEHLRICKNNGISKGHSQCKQRMKGFLLSWALLGNALSKSVFWTYRIS